MSQQNDKSQEGLVGYVREAFDGVMVKNGEIIKEESMARTDEGVKVPLTDWISIPDGESVTAVYQGFDDDVKDDYGNKKFMFLIEGEDKERHISSGSRSFLEGIKDKKIGQKLLIAKTGSMATTKYIITLIV